MDATTRWLLAAVAANGLALGATGDQAVKQLPARHRIGPVAYAQYVRAADLGTGVRWYPPLGIGSAAITLAAVAVALRFQPTPARATALGAAAAGTLGHLATTACAAPVLLSLRRGELDPDPTRDVLDRFAGINAIRTAAMALALGAVVRALATASG